MVRRGADPAPKRSRAGAQRLEYRRRLAGAIKAEQQARLDAQTPDENRRRRAYYDSLPWTRKACWCGERTYSLHHARYDVPWPREVGAVSPMCPYHHALFHAEQWPRLKREGFSLADATLFLWVHTHGAVALLASPKTAQLTLEDL
jgi:hypothetical protein